MRSVSGVNAFVSRPIAFHAVASVYRLNSASGYPNTDEFPQNCKYIYYYKDEAYFKYEETDQVVKKSRDVSTKTNITYKAK